MDQLKRVDIQSDKPIYEAKIEFFEGIYEPNYLPVIAEKVKPYEVDGWTACLEGRFSPFKMMVEGNYLVSFLRKITPKDPGLLDSALEKSSG